MYLKTKNSDSLNPCILYLPCQWEEEKCKINIREGVWVDFPPERARHYDQNERDRHQQTGAALVLVLIVVVATVAAIMAGGDIMAAAGYSLYCHY